MAENKEKLFSDFPEVSTQEWMDKIQVDLKGADYEKKLVWKTNEGFKVKPFYRQEDLKGLKTIETLPGEFPYLRGNKKDDNTWYIRQDIRVENPEEANRKALGLLNKGIDSLGFPHKRKRCQPGSPRHTAERHPLRLHRIELYHMPTAYRTTGTIIIRLFQRKRIRPSGHTRFGQLRPYQQDAPERERPEPGYRFGFRSGKRTGRVAPLPLHRR